MGSRRIRGRAGWAALALVVLAACSVPEENGGSSHRDSPASTDASAATTVASGATAPDPKGPHQDATLTGRIVGRDGKPVAGLPVTVVENRPSAGLDAALTGIFTLGIACIATADACDGTAKVVDSATTGSDGRFELTLPKAYLPGFETDEDWVVQVGRAPVAGEQTGPSSSFELEVNTARQESPDLALWDATPTVSTSASQLAIDIPPLTGGAALSKVSPRFVNDRGEVVWNVRGKAVDPRVLEDQSTRLVSSGSADVTVRHVDGRTIYHQSVATPTVAYAGTLTPVSRGSACTLTGGALVGCPFTDGDLTAPTGIPARGLATVDLGTASEVGLVVVRGNGSNVGTPVRVEGSADGTTWADLPFRALDGANGWSASPTGHDGFPSLRFVRVSEASEVAEISVWAPTDAERAAAVAETSATEDDNDSALPKALAVVLVVAVAGAAIVLRRRR